MLLSKASILSYLKEAGPDPRGFPPTLFLIYPLLLLIYATSLDDYIPAESVYGIRSNMTHITDELPQPGEHEGKTYYQVREH